jgi:phosphoenolpyruvate carboxylase
MSDTVTNFQSTDQLVVARELSGILLEKMQERNSPVFGQLLQLREAVFDEIPNESQEQKQHRIDKLKENALRFTKNPEERQEFLQGVMRLGQCYDMAWLVARSNFLKEQRENWDNPEKNLLDKDVKEHFEKTAALGSKTVVDNAGSIDDAIKILNEPVFECVFTAHPTSVHSRENVAAMRDVNTALHDIRRGKENAEETLKSAVAKWVETPVVPQQENNNGESELKKFSVHDEVTLGLDDFKRAYHDVVYAYRRADESLDARAAKKDEAYHKEDLKLGMRYSSWIGGDKDGNPSITSETTLETILLHKLKAIECYQEDLRKRKKGYQGTHRDFKNKIWGISSRLKLYNFSSWS